MVVGEDEYDIPLLGSVCVLRLLCRGTAGKSGQSSQHGRSSSHHGSFLSGYSLRLRSAAGTRHPGKQVNGRSDTSYVMGLAMSGAALSMAYQVAGKAARDALFLSNFHSHHLPAMIVAGAIAAMLLG